MYKKVFFLSFYDIPLVKKGSYMDRKTNIENYFLKKQLLDDKRNFPSKSLEIAQKLEDIEMASLRIDDLPKSLKSTFLNGVERRPIPRPKLTYSKMVRSIILQQARPISAREILVLIYKIFSGLNESEDRKHIRMVSNVLNQGFKKGEYQKVNSDSVTRYSSKEKSL
ncbi:hypothetical protein SAMN04487898_12376 [Pedobacter sp. ok626]|nr:hypothetical protein SAMN04487898_12376 [Pedobacter sp. ok626]